jgi:hypothetical protein
VDVPVDPSGSGVLVDSPPLSRLIQLTLSRSPASICAWRHHRRSVSSRIPRRRRTPSHDFVTEPGFNLVFGNQSHSEP